MKVTLINIVTVLLLSFTVTASAQYSSIIVIKESDNSKINGVKVGVATFKETGFRVNCNYNDGIEYLKERAKEQEANVIKITMHKSPDRWSSCHRFEADLYQVGTPTVYEKEILWSAGRKLTWEDFRAEMPLSANDRLAAETYCELSFTTRKATMFSKTKHVVKTVFHTDKSWATNNKEHQNNYILNHEQKHFDLCEIYARMLYKELSGSKINAFNIQEANDIFNRIQLAYKKRQYDYDMETAHGINEDAQKEWNKTISNELLSLKEYAKHD